MGKRSDFKRRPQDAYDTPPNAVVPLIYHLPSGASFCEPCAGKGNLSDALVDQGFRCAWESDIEPRSEGMWRADALTLHYLSDFIITNPPWTRSILHKMIEYFSDQRATWLLFDADWVHTKQAIPFLPRLRKIVSVGRVKWIPDSPRTGKDNCAWYLFDKPGDTPAQFFGRTP